MPSNSIIHIFQYLTVLNGQHVFKICFIESLLKFYCSKGSFDPNKIYEILKYKVKKNLFDFSFQHWLIFFVEVRSLSLFS